MAQTPIIGVQTTEVAAAFYSPAKPILKSTEQLIVGPTVKGPNKIPTEIESYAEYVKIFGEDFGGEEYLTSVAVRYHFSNGTASPITMVRVAEDSAERAKLSVYGTIEDISPILNAAYNVNLVSTVTNNTRSLNGTFNTKIEGETGNSDSVGELKKFFTSNSANTVSFGSDFKIDSKGSDKGKSRFNVYNVTNSGGSQGDANRRMFSFRNANTKSTATQANFKEIFESGVKVSSQEIKPKESINKYFLDYNNAYHSASSAKAEAGLKTTSVKNYLKNLYEKKEKFETYRRIKEHSNTATAVKLVPEALDYLFEYETYVEKYSSASGSGLEKVSKAIEGVQTVIKDQLNHFATGSGGNINLDTDTTKSIDGVKGLHSDAFKTVNNLAVTSASSTFVVCVAVRSEINYLLATTHSSTANNLRDNIKNVLSDVGSKLYGYSVAIGTALKATSNVKTNGKYENVIRALKGKRTADQELSKTHLFDLYTFGHGKIYNTVASSVDAPGVTRLGTTDSVGSNNNGGVYIQISKGLKNDEFKLEIVQKIEKNNVVTTTTLKTYPNLSLNPADKNFIGKKIGDLREEVIVDSDESYVVQKGKYKNLNDYIYVDVKYEGTGLKGIRLDQFSSVESIVTPDTGSSETVTLETAPLGMYANKGANPEPDSMKNYTANTGSFQGYSLSNLKSTYKNVTKILNDNQTYSFELVTVPGIIYGFNSDHKEVADNFEKLVRTRGDSFYIYDIYNSDATISNVVAKDKTGINSSYVATYFPWVMLTREGTKITVPASVVIPTLYYRMPNKWYAPAGARRGRLTGVTKTNPQIVSRKKMNDIHNIGINPIVRVNGLLTVMGQKTGQVKDNALNRINIRRMVNYVKTSVTNYTENFLFEFNSNENKVQIQSWINNLLLELQNEQALYSYELGVYSNEDYPEEIRAEELVIKISVKPTATLESITFAITVENKQ